MKRFLILVHHDGARISAGVRSCVNAVLQCGAAAELLVIQECGADESLLDEARCMEHVSRVMWIQAPAALCRSSEYAADAFAHVIRSGDYQGGVACSDTYGKDVLPRLAACFLSSPVTDVCEVGKQEGVFSRFVHAGSLVEKVRVRASPVLLTFRASCFGRVGDKVGADMTPLEIVRYNERPDLRVCQYLGGEPSARSGRPDPAFARVVVSGGRGTRGKEGFSLLEALADEIECCAIGASRAAVDAGYATGDMQIGQTGKIVSPELYIAAGISGAAQHWAGMKGSRIIVCVNTDMAAPLCESADFILNDDLFRVLPELASMIRGSKADSSAGSLSAR